MSWRFKATTGCLPILGMVFSIGASSSSAQAKPAAKAVAKPVPVAKLASANASVEPTMDERLAAVIAQRVRGALPPHLAVVDVQVPQLFLRGRVDPQSVSLRWRTAPRPGTIAVEARAQADNGAAVKAWTRIQLRELVNVVVVARPIRAGAKIQDGDLRLEPHPVPRGQGWRLSPDTVIGKAVLRDATPGTIVDSTIIEQPAPLARGNPMRVVVRKGRVTISTTGVLEIAARPGEITSVRLDSARTLIRGRIIDHNTVLVEGKL